MSSYTFFQRWTCVSFEAVSMPAPAALPLVSGIGFNRACPEYKNSQQTCVPTALSANLELGASSGLGVIILEAAVDQPALP